MPARPGTNLWREQVWGPPCQNADLVVTYWMLGAPKVRCNRRAVPAFRALGRVIWRYGYHVRGDVTGAYNCRKITGGSVMSPHSWGIAIDVNWDTNPYRRDRLVTDMPVGMREEIEGMRTLYSDKVWRWGGDWDGRPETSEGSYDSMHYEIVASPSQIPAKAFPVDAMNPLHRATWALLALGDRGPAVRQLQELLGIVGPDADGIFGPRTESVLKDYQKERELTVDGVCGLGTLTALFTRQPTIADGAPTPYKRMVA